MLEGGREEVIVTVAFLDELGAEQFTVLRTTLSAAAMRERSGMMRAMIEHYYSAMGCEILSVQARYETSYSLAESVPDRPKLRLVPTHIGKKCCITLAVLALYLVADVGGGQQLLAACLNPTRP